MKKILYVILLILLMSVLVACGKQSVKSIISEFQGGEPFSLTAQDLTLPLVGGGSGSLAQYKGKVLVFSVWISTCHYCQKEAPLLVELNKYLKDDNRIQLLGVSIDGTLEAAQNFVEVYGITYPNMFDPSGEIVKGKGFSIRGTPTTFIISPEGNVLAKITGHYDFEPKEYYKSLVTLYKLFESK